MALTVNWQTKVVYSDTSITDIPAHHRALRDIEASETGMLYDDICAWQSLDLGGGATLPQIDYINGYGLEFVGPGPFVISGNLNAPINDTGVQVERKTSAAYATTSVGGSGPSAESIAAATVAAMISSVVPVNSVMGSWPTAQQNADTVWSHSFVSKLLTVAKFLGLK